VAKNKQAYANSGMTTRLNLVLSYATDYIESGDIGRASPRGVVDAAENADAIDETAATNASFRQSTTPARPAAPVNQSPKFYLRARNHSATAIWNIAGQSSRLDQHV
jgi:hypothetical protein